MLEGGDVIFERALLVCAFWCLTTAAVGLAIWIYNVAAIYGAIALILVPFDLVMWIIIGGGVMVGINDIREKWFLYQWRRRHR